MFKQKKLKVLSKPKLLALKPFLDDAIQEIEIASYIDSDPILFMHAYTDKNDQELAGFFAAIMAWGRRDIVIAKVEDLLGRMNHRPTEFIANFTDSDAPVLDGFKHRTFKALDIYWFIRALQSILRTHGTFEGFWQFCQQQAQIQNRELIALFHEEFFNFHPETPQRCRKHISNPEKNSSCKRLYMYLRWCIRSSVVDLGLMSFITPAELKIPLDVHVARQARKLGLLTRKQNDWKAVQELTNRLSILDPDDPTKYDFALFGIGVLGRKIPDAFILNKESKAIK